MFKCLIFIRGLITPSEKVRTRLLTKLEQDQKITLQSLAEECQRILNLRADTAKIEERDISNIHTIKKKGKKNKQFFKINLCCGSGELYLFKDCPFKHKEAVLAGAKDTNYHTVDLERGIIQKIKKCSRLNKQQLKKCKENIYTFV